MFQRERDRDRFDRFTERARKVLALSQEEAQRFNHNYIGTEHLLLGLIREQDGIAARVLGSLGVELETVRRAVEHIIGRGDRIVLGEVGLTPRSKKVMELAVDEARRLNHRYIGTEHLLLGLIREGEGIAAGVLTSLGLTLEKVRTQTLRFLSQTGEPTAALAEQAAQGGVRSNVVTCRLDDRTLEAIDALVEAGVRATRSEAAAWLISAGIEANRELFTRVNATVAEIRRLRAEAQAIAQQVVGNGGGEPAQAAQPPTGTEPLSPAPELGTQAHEVPGAENTSGGAGMHPTDEDTPPPDEGAPRNDE